MDFSPKFTGQNAAVALLGSAVGMPWAGQLFGSIFGGKKQAPPPTFDQVVQGKAKPIASTGLANVLAQSMVLPAQLDLAQEYNPRLAQIYGQSYNSLLNAILPQYENNISPTINRINAAGQSAQRTADVADVTNLAPGLRNAFNLLTPESAAAYARMGEIVNADLQNPTGLSPFEQRRIEQTFRSRPGYSGGLGDQMQEALSVYAGGERQKQQRLANAAALIASGKQMYGDPMMAITGRSSGTVQNALGFGGQLAGQSQQAGQGTFDAFNNQGLNNVWGSLFSYDQNLQNLAAAKSAGDKQLAGSIIGGLGGLAAGFI